MGKNSKEAYWDRRAKEYEKLDWVKNAHYLKEVVQSVRPKQSDVVLDVGTGMGAVAKALSPHVGAVIGVDFSQNMLHKAGWAPNIHYLKWDISEPLFHDEVFEKVVARQVLHHIANNAALIKVFDNCYNVLKRGGSFVIAEPVCPCAEIAETYREIFDLKDGRLIFTVDDIINMVNKTGFSNVVASSFRLEGFSVKNWLDNNSLTPAVQNKIFEMHVTASSAFRKAFNMRIINGDCLIDIKNVIVVGIK